MPTAYSYVRFSTPEQAKGNSLVRQSELIAQFIDTYNQDNDEQMVLDTTLRMSDLGISAYKGKNKTEGCLSAFVEAVKAGKVAKGSYLLVESLDRLSREHVSVALLWFIDLVEKQGITICTLSDNYIYKTGQLDTTSLIISLTIMSRAHEESRIKAQRLQSAWNEKRANLSTRKLTGLSPKWLELNEAKDAFNIIPDRVELIQQIYKWADEDGYGSTLIVRMLTEDNVDTWGNTSNSNKRKPKKWHVSTLTKILTNRAVLGEFKYQTPEGEMIELHYFPPIISPKLFHRVQAKRASRQINGSGRKGKTFSNIFTGQKFVCCGYCGSTMAYKDKGNEWIYLTCNNLKCKNRKGWIYQNFMINVLSFIKHIDFSVMLPDSARVSTVVDNLKDLMLVAQSEIKEDQKQLEKLSTAIETIDSIPVTMIRKMGLYEARIIEGEDTVRKLSEKLSVEESKESNMKSGINELVNVIDLLNNTDKSELFNTRMRLNQLLKTYVIKIECFINGLLPEMNQAFYEIQFESGVSRIVIPHRDDAEKFWMIGEYNLDDDFKMIELGNKQN